MQTLLVATHNRGKVAELADMLAASGIACVSLDDAGITHDVPETGATFLENATLKATAYARLSGQLTLADDSGLEVDALGGAPGVLTARFGGPGLTQPERNRLLLSRLAHHDGAARAARFRCVVVLADADGTVVATADGVCPGAIAAAPAGSGGFGYDPVFYLPEQGCTMAELDSAEKHAISHRGQAFRAILPAIRAALGTR